MTTKINYNQIKGTPVNVLDYGADSTGVSDSTTAFQSALATGSAVYVPKGTFLITGALQLQDGQVMFGDGSGVTVITCNQASFSGILINMGGHTLLRGITVTGTGTAAATGIKCWDSSDQYNFTGYVTLSDVNINGFLYGLRVNNIFMLEYDVGIVYSNTYGIYIVPAYSASYDSGYVTTLTFNKVYMHDNGLGIYAISTSVSKNIMLRDCVIELNYTAAGQQSYFNNIAPLTVENLYIEGSNTIVAMQIINCETVMNQIYMNDTGGMDLGAGSNTLIGTYIYGTSAGDNLVATGTSLQKIHLYNCNLSTSSSLNASVTHLYNTQIDGAFYKNFSRNIPVTLSTYAQGTNVSAINDILAYTKTVTATINAGVTGLLITDQAINAAWTENFAIAVASISNAYNPGLILTVTPATTGNTGYFCVLATNTTAGTITLTNALLKVLFMSGTAGFAL